MYLRGNDFKMRKKKCSSVAFVKIDQFEFVSKETCDVFEKWPSMSAFFFFSAVNLEQFKI